MTDKNTYIQDNMKKKKEKSHLLGNNFININTLTINSVCCLSRALSVIACKDAMLR